jgi:hypothetical protein
MGEIASEKATYSTSVEAGPVHITEKTHQWDPNLKQDKIDELHAATHEGDLEAIKRAEKDFLEYRWWRACKHGTSVGPRHAVRHRCIWHQYVLVDAKSSYKFSQHRGITVGCVVCRL